MFATSGSADSTDVFASDLEVNRHEIVGHDEAFPWLHVCYGVPSVDGFRMKWGFFTDHSDFDAFIDEKPSSRRPIVSVQRMQGSKNIPYIYRLLPIRRVWSFVVDGDTHHRYEMHNHTVEYSHPTVEGHDEERLLYEEK